MMVNPARLAGGLGLPATRYFSAFVIADGIPVVYIIVLESFRVNFSSMRQLQLFLVRRRSDFPFRLELVCIYLLLFLNDEERDFRVYTLMYLPSTKRLKEKDKWSLLAFIWFLVSYQIHNHPLILHYFSLP